jgi:hypothetical protein
MKTLTDDQAYTLASFLDAFDLHLTGAWPAVRDGMADEFGIEDPEAALEDAREALSQ